MHPEEVLVAAILFRRTSSNPTDQIAMLLLACRIKVLDALLYHPAGSCAVPVSFGMFLVEVGFSFVFESNSVVNL